MFKWTDGMFMGNNSASEPINMMNKFHNSKWILTLLFNVEFGYLKEFVSFFN